MTFNILCVSCVHLIVLYGSEVKLTGMCAQMDMLRLNPEADMEWADRTKALANVVLKTVQVENVATYKQLEKTQMVVDLILCRLQYLDDQLRAALKDKVVIKMVHNMIAKKRQRTA